MNFGSVLSDVCAREGERLGKFTSLYMPQGRLSGSLEDAFKPCLLKGSCLSEGESVLHGWLLRFAQAPGICMC